MHRIVVWIARILAVLGGLLLLAIVGLICVSVAGRALNTVGHADWFAGAAPGLANWLLGTGVSAVKGDFELVEAGMAVVIFAFLPWCQVIGGHATVDVFSGFLPKRGEGALAAFWEVVFALTLGLLAWQLWLGTEGKIRSGETSYLLQFPVWWAYAASLVAATAAFLVAAWCAFDRCAAVALNGPARGAGGESAP